MSARLGSPGRIVLVCAVGLLSLALGLHYALAARAAEGRVIFPMDDPYIHLQFARNLASGQGWSFNPGEPTPGATSPAWVVLLAVTRLLHLPPEGSALALSLFAGALACALTAWSAMALGLSPFAAGAAGVVLASSGRFAWMSASGMETCFAAAVAVLMLGLSARPLATPRRALAVGAIAGLGAQLRPELLLVAGVVGVVEAVRLFRAREPADEGRRRRGSGSSRAALSVLPLLIYGCVVVAIQVPYIAFALHTTGRPLPNTFYAKSIIPMHAGAFGHLRLRYLWDVLVWLGRDNRLLPFVLIPAAVLWIRRRRPAAVVAAPLAFWLSSLVLSPVHYNMSRYDVPFLPAVVLIAVAPLDELARLVAQPALAILHTLAALVVLGAGVMSHAWGARAYAMDVATTSTMQFSMAEWVRDHMPPGARIATHDVGAITYYGHPYCIDMIGLVSSDVIDAYHGVDIRKVNPLTPLYEYLSRSRPDAFVIFPAWYPDIPQQPWARPLHAIHWNNTTGGADDLVAYAVRP